MAKTIDQTTTMSPENVIAQAVNNIVGGRWRVDTQGPRNAVFVLEENKFKTANLLAVGCLLVLFVVPGLIMMVILALRDPNIEARITLTAIEEAGVTTVVAQVDGGDAEAKVRDFLATLP